VLASLSVPPEELRTRIRRIRALTDRPFGVNLWMHSELRPPVDPATLPADAVRDVQSVLNRFRARLDVPATDARPATGPAPIEAAFDVMLEERAPVFSTGIGLPDAEMVKRCHAQGTKVIAMVATVEDARAAAALGADAVIAQGGEAGGHRSVGVKPAAPETASVGTLALVPPIADAVAVPVLAAGGIADGRGLVAALALGASGVLLGTRFVATRESMAPEFWKKRVLELDGTATTVTDAFTGQWARVLRNTFATEYGASGAPVLPGLLQTVAAQDVYAAAAARGDSEYYHMYAGQSVGLIHDLPGAGEVVEAIVREARAVLAALPRRVRTD
jgi:nitronate monooxygenase